MKAYLIALAIGIVAGLVTFPWLSQSWEFRVLDISESLATISADLVGVPWLLPAIVALGIGGVSVLIGAKFGTDQRTQRHGQFALPSSGRAVAPWWNPFAERRRWRFDGGSHRTQVPGTNHVSCPRCASTDIGYHTSMDRRLCNNCGHMFS